jgi:regulator of RNase E activity RraA
MPITRYAVTYQPLSASELDLWKSYPTSHISDAMGRCRCIAPEIKPLKPGMRLAGHARTVQGPPGDNAAVHAAAALLGPAEVLMIDAGGFTEVAVWGGVLTSMARRRGVAGVVLDGATRDSDEVVDSGFALFCRAITPRSGSKLSVGTIDGPISVGGVIVRSGDLVVGDDDGVVVVPYQEIRATLDKVKAAVERERQISAEIDRGRTSAEILGIAIPEVNAS